MGREYPKLFRTEQIEIARLTMEFCSDPLTSWEVDNAISSGQYDHELESWLATCN